MSEGMGTTHSNSGDWKQRVQHMLLARESMFVVLVFLLAFIVRATLLRYELFFEFDSYWHARMVSYILQGIPITGVDPLGYYHNVAAATFGNAPYLFWYVSAVFYKIFTLNAPYDVERWIFLVKILPALYGALICVAMYFLGKELFAGTPHARSAGMLAGILAAVVPAFVYRTMGGFFEDDSLGFFWMVVGFVFFVRATRHGEWGRKQMVDAVLAGVSFALMAFTWSAFNILVPVLLGVGVTEFLVWLREGEFQKAKHYAMAWGISFILLAAGATLQTGVFWLNQLGGMLASALFGQSDYLQAPHVLFFFALLAVLMGAAWWTTKHQKMSPRVVRTIASVVILLLVVAPLVVFLFNVSLRTGGVLGQTIGEESDGRHYFGNKYSFMMLFAIVGLPLCGYLLWKRARQYAFLALPVVWLVVTFFMAWGKLKFTYYWGLPLALMGAIVLILAHQWATKQSVRTRQVVAITAGFLLLMSTAIGIVFVTQNVPNIETSPGWKSALFWAQDHLPANAKFFNWWDEGHWISFLSQRGVLIDNRNADPKATADVAKVIISSDAADAHALVTKYGSTHLIFGDDLLEKYTNLGFYAYNTTNSSDPRLQGLFGVVMPCTRQETALTHDVTYACGSNQFTQAEMQNIPTSWNATPSTLQNGVPIHLYRDESNQRVYAFTTNSNKAVLTRLWFGDDALDPYFTEIYRNAGGVRIFEVNEGVSVPVDVNASSDTGSISDANAS